MDSGGSPEDVDALLAATAGVRVKYFFRRTVETGLLYSWGDGMDFEFLEDSEGLGVLPVWPSQELATRAFAKVNPSYRPIQIELSRFLSLSLGDLERAECGLAIFPIGLRIALSLVPERFRSKIEAEQRRVERGTEW